MTDSIALKVQVTGTGVPLFRRLVVSPSSGYDELVKVIGKKRFTYEDDEGDVVAIASQAEFLECLRIVAHRPLRLNVCKPTKTAVAQRPGVVSSSSSSDCEEPQPQAGFPSQETSRAMHKAARLAAREARRSFHAARQAAMVSVGFPASGAPAPGTFAHHLSHVADRARHFAMHGPAIGAGAPFSAFFPQGLPFLPADESLAASPVAPSCGTPAAPAAAPPCATPAAEDSRGASAPAARGAPTPACVSPSAGPATSTSDAPPAGAHVPARAADPGVAPLVALGFPESLARDVLAFHGGDVAAARDFLSGN